MRPTSAVTKAESVIIAVVVIAAGFAGYIAVTASQPPKVLVQTATETATQLRTQVLTTTATQVEKEVRTVTQTQVQTVTATPAPPPKIPLQNPGTLLHETFGQPDFLDPAVDYETAGAYIIQNVYEQLLFYKGEDASKVVPWLAESIAFSPDGLRYTLKLRKGIKFHDGTPFNATAVWHSTLRTMLIDDPNGPSWAISQVLRGGRAYSKSYDGEQNYGPKYTQQAVDDLLKAKPVEIVDPFTVAFNLEYIYAAFPTILAFSVTAVVSPTAVIKNWVPPKEADVGVWKGWGVTAGQQHEWLNSKGMVGTGPYIFKSWDKATGTIVLEANPNYWGGPDGNVKTRIKTVIIKEVLDEQTRILDLKAGNADVITVNPENLMTLVNQDLWFKQGKLQSIVDGVAVYGPFPQLATHGMMINLKIKDATGKFQEFQPFIDKRIREAFILAFDQDTYVRQVLKNLAPKAHQIVPPGMFGYDPTISRPRHDPDLAKKLLLDAGANPIIPANAFGPKNPKQLTIFYNQGNLARETGATLLASAINRLDTGINVAVAGLAWPQFLATVRGRQAPVFFVGWIVDYVDPDNFLVPFAHGKAGTFATRMSYDDETVNSLVDQAGKELDPVKRRELITRIQQAVNAAAVYIWTNHGVATRVARDWLKETASPAVGTGLKTYNTAIYGLWLADIIKGE